MIGIITSDEKAEARIAAFENNPLIGLFSADEVSNLKTKLSNIKESKEVKPKKIKEVVEGFVNPSLIINSFFDQTKTTYKIKAYTEKPAFEIVFSHRDGFDISNLFTKLDVSFSKKLDLKKNIVYIIKYSELEKLKDKKAFNFK